MIDNPITAADLMEKLNAALPIPARLTPELQVSFRGGPDLPPIPATAMITFVYYMGDEGGILCKIDLGPDIEKEAFASITHLRFDPRLPLAREITVYQKHRVKRLRRQQDSF